MRMNEKKKEMKEGLWKILINIFQNDWMKNCSMWFMSIEAFIYNYHSDGCIVLLDIFVRPLLEA